jgi:dipeptidase D
MTHQKTNEILNRFEQISQIPRCSGNEGAICQWLIDWAKGNGFAVKTDKVQNLLIKVPASLGYENAPIVVLQGHLDMVCEKTPEANHDFAKDPIKLIYDGEWLRADKTTLGADNGIAIAIGMTLAEEKDVPHPPLELLFTVDEETGLHGAAALESGFFEGRRLINIDSEQEGYLTVGSGGLNTDISVPIAWREVPTHYQLMKINAGGMSGGHSGIDINAGKANAVKVLVQTLHLIRQQVGIRLVNLSGGTAHNAIPRDSEAKVFVSKNDIKLIVLEAEKTLKAEYQKTEPNLFIKVDACDESFHQAMDLENTNKVIDFIMALPHGVAAMSSEIKGLVETSNNLATVSVEAGQLRVLSSQRSSVESRLDALTDRIEALARLVGGKADSGNRYPAWQPNMASGLLAKSSEIYESLFNKPVVDILHAGLECGIIGNKVLGMDMISIGPTIKYPHSPDEKIDIGSIGRVWDFLLALLKELNISTGINEIKGLAQDHKNFC